MPGVSLLTSIDINNDTGAVSDLTVSHVKNDTSTMSKMIPIIKQYINNENNECVAHSQQYQFLSIPSREEVLTRFTGRGTVTENVLFFPSFCKWVDDGKTPDKFQEEIIPYAVAHFNSKKTDDLTITTFR